MHNIWKWLFIGLLCCILISTTVLAFAVNQFNTSGIHVLGCAAHVGGVWKCYILDLESGTAEESTFSASGYLFGRHFYGVLDIDQHSIPADAMKEITGEIKGNHLLLDGPEYKFTATLAGEEWVRYYRVWIHIGKPNNIVVNIHENGKPTKVAVCANSTEEAWENYQAYAEHIFSE